MRKLLAVLLVLGSASAAFGFDGGEGEVRWDGISGVVTALNVDNPVSSIDSGTFAWTARGGIGDGVAESPGPIEVQDDRAEPSLTEYENPWIIPVFLGHLRSRA